jgi:hypothetical protein
MPMRREGTYASCAQRQDVNNENNRNSENSTNTEGLENDRPEKQGDGK